MTLTVTHMIGDMENEKATAIARQETQGSDTNTYSSTKLLTQNVSYLQERQGQRME